MLRDGDGDDGISPRRRGGQRYRDRSRLTVEWLQVNYELSTSHTLLVAGTAFVAGLMRGFSGFGAALTIAPILAVIVGPRAAIPAILFLMMATSVQLAPKAFSGRELAHCNTAIRWRGVWYHNWRLVVGRGGSRIGKEINFRSCDIFRCYNAHPDGVIEAASGHLCAVSPVGWEA